MKKIFMLALFALSLQVRAQKMDGSWQGSLMAGTQKLTMIFSIDQQNKSVKLTVPQLGVQDAPLTVNVLTADSLNVSIAQLGSNYAGKLQGDSINGSFHHGMSEASVNLRKGELKYNRPQEPQPPYPYQTEEVSFMSGDATLSGTLTYPVGYKKGQKTKVLLMVTGSGQEDRNQELFHHKPFLVVADWLARHGVATLRYDDRGFGKSTGDLTNATTATFAQDAEAGINYLRSRKQFNKVGLLGCSEGGSIGFMVASKGKIDFLVNWAGPACKIDTMMVLQINGLARAQGYNKNMVNTVAEARKMVVAQKDDAWIRYFLDLDMRPYVGKTTCPVLTLCGEKDLNVPVSINVQALKENLPANKLNEIKVYPGLNHLLQPSKTGSMTESFSTDLTISPQVLEDMTQWLNKF